MYMYTPTSDNFARARAEDVNASFKDLGAVCDAVRGMNVIDAINYLNDVVNEIVPVYYKKHNKGMGHRRQLGGRKGRWPMKEAKIVMKLIMSAVANASAKGLIEEDLVITHIAANKQHIYARMAPRGRQRRSFYETAFVEVVVEETMPFDQPDKKRKHIKADVRQAKQLQKTKPKVKEKEKEKKQAKNKLKQDKEKLKDQVKKPIIR